MLGDALAVVTGRPVETDRCAAGRCAVRGGRRAWRRDPPCAGPGAGAARRCRHRPQAWLAAAERLAAAHPGALLERKPRGFALHYRAVPAAGPALHDALTALLAGSADFELLAGADDLGGAAARRRQGQGGRRADGNARRLLGRLPVFIGDDVTDEDGIAAAQALGGVGLRVPEAFGDAAGVRAWLKASAAAGRFPGGSP